MTSGSRTMETRRAFHDIGVLLPASLFAATAALPWRWLPAIVSQLAERWQAQSLIILDDSAGIGVVYTINGWTTVRSGTNTCSLDPSFGAKRETFVYNRCNRPFRSFPDGAFDSIHSDELTRRNTTRPPAHAHLSSQLLVIRRNVSV